VGEVGGAPETRLARSKTASRSVVRSTAATIATWKTMIATWKTMIATKKTAAAMSVVAMRKADRDGEVEGRGLLVVPVYLDR
jgi:hypothetical protein